MAQPCSIEIEFLGTGTSTGVPLIGCSCPVCQSQNPKNHRLRSSIVIRSAGLTLLVDSGPDLRQQALRQNLLHIDAILYTHAHLDHITGFDDLRAYCWHRNGGLPMFASEATLATLKRMFPWAFSPENMLQKGYIRPEPYAINSPFFLSKENEGINVRSELIDDCLNEEIRADSLCVTKLPVFHGNVETNGFLFEINSLRAAYIPDAKSIPDSSLLLMKDLDLLIIDTLRKTPHPTHMSIDESSEYIAKLAPKRAILTHMSHEIDYPKFADSLPENIQPAYDGMKVYL